MPDQLNPTDEDPGLTAILVDLLAIGTKVAQGIGRQADLQAVRQADLQAVRQADLQAQPTLPGQTPHPATDLAEQFERVSRAMRRTVLLIRHLAKPGAASSTDHRTQARKRIIREIEDAIEREPGALDPAEARVELLDRLDSLDLEEEIANRSIPDIIKDIRRDLGLSNLPFAPPWTLRTAQDIETLRTRATAPTPTVTKAPDPRGSGLAEGEPTKAPSPCGRGLAEGNPTEAPPPLREGVGGGGAHRNPLPAREGVGGRGAHQSPPTSRERGGKARRRNPPTQTQAPPARPGPRLPRDGPTRPIAGAHPEPGLSPGSAVRQRAIPWYSAFGIMSIPCATRFV